MQETKAAAFIQRESFAKGKCSYDIVITRKTCHIYSAIVKKKSHKFCFSFRFVFSGTGLSNEDFLDIIGKNESSQNEDEGDLDEYDRQRIERQEGQMKRLQATVDAQSKVLTAIANKLGINE